jgi:hypothetical protein
VYSFVIWTSGTALRRKIPRRSNVHKRPPEASVRPVDSVAGARVGASAVRVEGGGLGSIEHCPHAGEDDRVLGGDVERLERVGLKEGEGRGVRVGGGVGWVGSAVAWAASSMARMRASMIGCLEAMSRDSRGSACVGGTG